jgi:hypothetical protein
MRLGLSLLPLLLATGASAHVCGPLKAPKSPDLARYAADMTRIVDAAGKTYDHVWQATGAMQITRAEPARRQFRFSFAESEAYRFVDRSPVRPEETDLFLNRIIKECLLRQFPFLAEDPGAYNLHPVRVTYPKVANAEQRKQLAYDRMIGESDEAFDAQRAATAMASGLLAFTGSASTLKSPFTITAVADPKTGQFAYVVSGDFGHYR